MLYVVYGPRDSTEEHLREVHDLIVARYGEEVVFAVYEVGKQKTHPHLNYIFDTHQRSDTFRRSFRNTVKFPKELWGTVDDKYTFHVKNVSDLARLVTRYLSKEDDAQILLNRLDVALLESEMEKRADDFVYTKSDGAENMKVVSEPQVIQMSLHYFRARELTPETFRRFQAQFALQLFYCSRIKWLRVYNYCVIHSGQEIATGDFPILYEL